MSHLTIFLRKYFPSPVAAGGFSFWFTYKYLTCTKYLLCHIMCTIFESQVQEIKFVYFFLMDCYLYSEICCEKAYCWRNFARDFLSLLSICSSSFTSLLIIMILFSSFSMVHFAGCCVFTLFWVMPFLLNSFASFIVLREPFL